MSKSGDSPTISRKTEDSTSGLIPSQRRWTVRKSKASKQHENSFRCAYSLLGQGSCRGLKAVKDSSRSSSINTKKVSASGTRFSYLTGGSSMPVDSPAIHVCKQSVVADTRDVQNLELTCHKAMFGEVDIFECIEKRICRSMFNVKNELVAFIVIQSQPNVSSIYHCRNWFNWIRQFYRLEDATPENTCFISYLVWDPRYRDFFGTLMKSIYKNNVRLEQALLVVPPGIHIFKELADYFTCIFPHGLDSMDMGLGQGGQAVYLNLRISLLNKLIVRKAAEEDNIDVQPLLAFQHDILKKIFGEFKLGDLIDLTDQKKTVIVAEHNAVTCGVMSLRTPVDCQSINEFFYVPLNDLYTKAGESTRSEIMKQEIDRELWTSEDDLTSLTPEAFLLQDDGNSTDSDSDSIYDVDDHDDRSISEILLDSCDSEFRIVDPAMEYLMSKKKHTVDGKKASRESVSSLLSLELSTFYGKGSWTVRKPSLLETKDTGALNVPKINLHLYPKSSVNISSDNGFKVELYALHPDLDHRYAFDMLEAAFGCYPEKHYCLMALPTDYQASPLTKHFVRLTPRLSRDFPHEMYIAHRNSIFSDFHVRAASRVDCDVIAELVEQLSSAKKILNDVTSILGEVCDGGRVFVMECEECIVGVAVISEGFGLQQLRPHYDLDSMIDLSRYDWESHGLLRHCVISTLFLKEAPYFLTQVMQLAGLDTLSYCLVPSELISKVGMSHVTVLGELRPVQPLHPVRYNLDSLVYKPNDFVIELEQEFALFIASERLLSIPNLELNYRIVVVGGSDTALSFLENLIFEASKKYVRYNNLTLVSLHGLPLHAKPHRAGDSMLATSGHFTREYLARLSLQTHVNILYGVVTFIKREEKMICLNDDQWMRYDYIFLFTGTQYCKPVPPEIISCDVDGCSKNYNVRDLYSQIPFQYCDNLFLVNTHVDSIIALTTLKRIVQFMKTGKVIVYGTGINMYTCVEALLTFGVPGIRIAVVQSTDSCGHYGLDLNREIEKTVENSLMKVGVVLIHGYNLFRWTVRNRLINKVEFRTEFNTPFTMECLGIFCFGTKVTSAMTYKAVTDSGLVFNNGIIIDNQFRTNDEFIYAAGPGTRYSNRYDDLQADHVHFSSLDVGRQASLIFRRLVEPRPHDDKEPSGDHLPPLRAPVTVVASLPGGWNYLRVSAPGKPIPLECQLQGQGESGPVLVTGEPVDPKGPGYFQLSLSIYGVVREIACLSMREIPVHNLQKLYGKHERLLNNLHNKFNLGLIPDLYAYFSEPWAYALYTSGFDQFVQQCADVFLADNEAGMKNIQNVILSQLNKETTIYRSSVDSEDYVSRMYSGSSLQSYVEHLTLQYVTDHSLQLPMYLTDEILASVLRAYAKSPLHRDHTKPYKNSPV